MLSPSSADASRVASSAATPSARLAARSASSSLRPGNAKSRSRMKLGGSSSCTLTITDERRSESIDERLVARRDDQVRAEQEIHLPRGNSHAVQPLAIRRDPHVRQHRAVLLREAGLVELHDVLAFEMRREPEQAARGHDAGAADARDENVVHGTVLGPPRLGQARQNLGRERPRRIAFRTLERDEARAETFETAEVLVARRLIDPALAPELRLERHHGQAVRLHVAVAAALAHELVDHHALVGGLDRAALALAVQLRRTGLIVDQRRHARNLAQLALDLVERAAVVHGDRRRQRRAARVLLGLIRHDHYRPHALRRELMRDAGDREVPLDRLAARHRDGVVEQDLVGHVHAGGHRGANREDAGMRVGAVAEVLEHVLGLGERRLADPSRAFPAHLRVRDGVAVHPRGHEVAADAADGAAAFGHARRRVVRAARAEVRLALHVRGELREMRLLLLEEAHAVLDVGARVEPAHPLREHARDQRRA